VNELARIEARDVVGARLVQIIGEVDLSNADDLMDVVTRAVPDDTPLLILDLSRTTYLDSTGIEMLFRLSDRLRLRRQDLRLVVPTKATIRAVLELTKVDHAIPIQESIVTATQDE
jgi:anti-anti-sigma factor